MWWNVVLCSVVLSVSYHTSALFVSVCVSYVVQAGTYSVILRLGTRIVCIINCSLCLPVLSLSFSHQLQSRVSSWKGLERPTCISICLFMRYIVCIFLYSYNLKLITWLLTKTIKSTPICTHVQTSISPTQIWSVPETCVKHARHKPCMECTGRRNLSSKPVKGVLTALQSGNLLYIPLLDIRVYTFRLLCFASSLLFWRLNPFEGQCIQCSAENPVTGIYGLIRKKQK